MRSKIPTKSPAFLKYLFSLIAFEINKREHVGNSSLLDWLAQYMNSFFNSEKTSRYY